MNHQTPISIIVLWTRLYFWSRRGRLCPIRSTLYLKRMEENKIFRKVKGMQTNESDKEPTNLTIWSPKPTKISLICCVPWQPTKFKLEPAKRQQRNSACKHAASFHRLQSSNRKKKRTSYLAKWSYHSKANLTHHMSFQGVAHVTYAHCSRLQLPRCTFNRITVNNSGRKQ